MITLLAFLLTVGVLVTVHEYGHYRVARACGVKVLRFSIGIGKPLFSWRVRGGETEFVVSALPLGGYVRMLDEREGPVAPGDLPRAFNRQSLLKRTAVVLAGPLANLVLAIVFFSAVNWIGMRAPQAIVSTPPQGSLAAAAGLRQGDRVLASSEADEGGWDQVNSFDELRWQVSQAALNQRDLLLQVQRPDGGRVQLVLALASLHLGDLNIAAMQRIGLMVPMAPPVLGEVFPGSAAAAAGLRSGDVVLDVDDKSIRDTGQLMGFLHGTAVAAQRAHEQAGAGGQVRLAPQQWRILRDGKPLTLSVTPRWQLADGVPVAVLGVRIGNSSEFATTLVRYGPLEGLKRGFSSTWEMSVLTLKMLGRMLIGEASIKNLSGPVSIAEYAGQSASAGVVQFVQFLAVVSLSLGVLNLLPLPVLDGGHLLYYLWEAVTGKAVSDWWAQRLQFFGIFALMLLMALALFNDFSRLLS